MPHKNSISVIIPNYNGRQLLEKYLPPCIAALETEGIDYEIIVVDDASSDESVDFIRKAYPLVSIMLQETNMGFSASCNLGITAAKYDLVMLLNSDVALEKDYFGGLWKYFEDPMTFGVMGQILNSHGKTEDAARKLAFQGIKFKATRFYSPSKTTSWAPTAYLSGANALIDRKKLLELGGFNELYSPFYVEDVDLSFRAWRMDWRCYYDPKAICHHEVSATTKSHHSKKKLYPILYRNKFILQEIHLEGLALQLWKVQLILLEILPRILLGKWWILHAYQLYRQQKPLIHESKVQLIRKARTKSIFEIKRRYFDPIKD
ncbi:hypothetical protein GCM10007049_02090 [Echinicola pacifica]|uniref:Glycosyltransferase 2-like domain-containing protein n=1 Tax=Echinicola pacifica TaxID=346377 RepID=A0A918UJ29_9BACT|nr:glycosyltransferase family 2 protein [Echinicola pacifica]GGZ13853.1 hypothetical protein GCM10007049_02090 [Echinicola pacifica]